jgi:hypothetical protein
MSGVRNVVFIFQSMRPTLAIADRLLPTAPYLCPTLLKHTDGPVGFF